MIFSATKDQKVTLFVDVSSYAGLLFQLVKFQFNGSKSILSARKHIRTAMAGI